MFNLIPALLLMLVAGPTGPVADRALLATEARLIRQVGSDDCPGALVRLALSRLLASPQQAVSENKDLSADYADAAPPLAAQAPALRSDGHFRAARLRDGPVA